MTAASKSPKTTKKAKSSPSKKPKPPVASGGGGSNVAFIVGIVVVLALGVLGVAVLATGRDSAIDPDIEATAPVELDGDALGAMPSGIRVTDPDTDPAAGVEAPTITGTTFDGEEVTIGNDGRPKVIYFLAHWCPHCQVEVPTVQGLIDAGSQPDGLDVYAVSTDVDAGRGNYPPYLWLDREGFEPITVRDDDTNTLLRSFGGGGFPFVVYLDAENRVISRSAGELPEDTIRQMWEATALSAAEDGDAADEGEAVDDGESSEDSAEAEDADDSAEDSEES